MPCPTNGRSRDHRPANARRAVAAAAVSAVGTVPAAAEAAWTGVEIPTGKNLHDVEYAAAGACAVGGGGQVIEQTDAGWRTVLDGGPAGNGNGNDLYGSDVTDDGKRLWVVGASGAVGEYDVETGDLNDRSAPLDNTNNYNDVAVTGLAGDANVYVAGDSGKVSTASRTARRARGST